MTCLVGQRVEVLVKNGSIISGIFHSANADKDFGMLMCLLCASALWKDLDVDSIIDIFFFVLPAKQMFFSFLMSAPPYIAFPSSI